MGLLSECYWTFLHKIFIDAGAWTYDPSTSNDILFFEEVLEYIPELLQHYAKVEEYIPELI